MKRALALFALLSACAPAASQVSVDAPTTAAVAAAPPSCHFEASRTLRERAHDLDSPSPSIALEATTAVLAESCSGPLVTLADRLASDPVLRRSRDAHGNLCDTAEVTKAEDAILTTTLASVVPPACFSDDRVVARACPLPWSVLSLWESEDEWAESRFFRETDRTVPAAITLGPRMALAAAIVARDRSFTAHSLAAHVISKSAPKVLVDVDGSKICREAEPN